MTHMANVAPIDLQLSPNPKSGIEWRAFLQCYTYFSYTVQPVTGLPKTWRDRWDRRDSKNGQSACPVCLRQTGQAVPSVCDRRDNLSRLLSRLSQTDGTSRWLLKHDRKDRTVKMANLPVPSVCETVTDRQTVPSAVCLWRLVDYC